LNTSNSKKTDSDTKRTVGAAALVQCGRDHSRRSVNYWDRWIDPFAAERGMKISIASGLSALLNESLYRRTADISLHHLDFYDRVNFPRRRAPRMMKSVAAEILDC